MLCELRIKNLAIIDDLSIQLKDGMSVLSGETGAGKSIIVNAVNLILGSRATPEMIRTGAQTAELEALFRIPDHSDTLRILEAQGYEPSEELLIRRIIPRNDRQRVYINGRLATLQLLSAVTANLAAISGQHEHQKLLDEKEHLLILDRFGGLVPLRTALRDCHREILPLISELEGLNRVSKAQQEKIALLEFQKKEILEAGVVPNEDETLKQEISRIRNAEMLVQAVQGAIDILYSSEGAVIEKLGEVRKSLEKAAAVDPGLSFAAPDLSDAAFRIEETTDRLRSYLGKIDVDRQHLERMESRLDALNRLKHKYGGSLEAVIKHLAAIEGELFDHENLPERIAQIEKALKEKHQRLAAIALDLSQKRRKTAGLLSKKMEEQLKSLKMSKTVFEVSFHDTALSSTPSPYLMAGNIPIAETGLEQARFMISPNLGEDVKPLSAIASGGELSRVVLSLKSIMADADAAGTMIFDEVDAGIGGEVAEVVGKKLCDLSTHTQVVCITHLAQIAVFAHHHFKITKHVKNRRTITCISPLDGNERLEETARMIGGSKITKATRDHAREMLDSGRARTKPGSKN